MYLLSNGAKLSPESYSRAKNLPESSLRQSFIHVQVFRMRKGGDGFVVARQSVGAMSSLDRAWGRGIGVRKRRRQDILASWQLLHLPSPSNPSSSLHHHCSPPPSHCTPHFLPQLSVTPDQSRLSTSEDSSPFSSRRKSIPSSFSPSARPSRHSAPL